MSTREHADDLDVAAATERGRATEAELRRSREELRIVLDSLTDGVLAVDRDLVITTANESAAAILGRALPQLLGSKLELAELSPVDGDGQPLAAAELPVARTLATGEPASAHIVGLQRFGAERVWFSIKARALFDHEVADVAGAVVTFADAAERRARERQLHGEARTDALTGIANRWALMDRLTGITDAQRRTVVFLDLNGFKEVNDSYGHAMGDFVLRQVAQRLRLIVRRGQDMLARFGGDEFVIVLCDVRDAELDELIARIRSAVAVPITLPNGHAVAVGVSVGAQTGHPGEHPAALVDRADQAMYAEKLGSARRPSVVLTPVAVTG